MEIQGGCGLMEITNVKIYDLEESIKASKYPMATNLDKLDSTITNTVKGLGKSKRGSGHDQFLTGIRVAFDLKCSNKMWVEMGRYRFVDFVSSQSTMHRITKFDIQEQVNEYVWIDTILNLSKMVQLYNDIEDKSTEDAKELYLQILYNTPSGFELTARLTTNYRALKTIYHQRKNHKLPEWREFCQWIEELPYFKELVLDDK